MPPTDERVQLIVRQLRRPRRTEQLNALRALNGLLSTRDDYQAIFSAGGVAALLDCASRSYSSGGSQAAAEEALSLLITLGSSSSSTGQVSQWRAGMLAASAVPLLVQQLGSSSQKARYFAALLLGGLACENLAVVNEAVQRGAVPLLVSNLRGSSCGRVHHAMAFAVVELSRGPASGDVMLRCGAVDALVALLRSDSASQETHKLAVWALSNIGLRNEQHGVAVARAGGFQAMLRLLQRGSPTAVAAAVRTLDKAATTWPRLLVAILADGGIPALQAFLQANPASPDADRARHLLAMLHLAQQSQLSTLRTADGDQSGSATRGSASASLASAHLATTSSGRASALPMGPADAAGRPSPAGASSASMHPPAAGSARLRIRHICQSCGDTAPAGTRFKLCAGCRQVRGWGAATGCCSSKSAAVGCACLLLCWGNPLGQAERLHCCMAVHTQCRSSFRCH